jgi:multidrug efflux pump subunit AcrB
VSALGFLASLTLAGALKAELIPAQDQSRIPVRIETPLGSSIAVTDEGFGRVEAFLRDRPEVAGVFGFVGGFSGAEVNVANIFTTLVPANQRRLSQQEFMDVIRRQFLNEPGLSVQVQDLSMMSFGQRGYQMEYAVMGPDPVRLPEIVRELTEKMAATGLFVDINTNYREGMPELRIAPDRKRASDLGVSMTTIGSTVNALLGGMRVVKYKDQGRRYDVRVRLLSGQRQRPEDIGSLLVRNRRGDLVRLSDVVRIEERPSPLTIYRRDRQRSITIMANLPPGKAQDEALKWVETACRESLPDGYRFAWVGGARMFEETKWSLLFALVLGIVVAYMILGAQFNSFIHPLTILLALPFCISGAFLFLWMFNQTINTYSMIGILLLMGIAKKNSILLVDFTNQVKERGVGTTRALMTACPIRLRPILMTSLSTIAAAVPAALAFGPGGELRTPMALAVIGGMLLSTVLSLVVVPCAYSVFDSVLLRVRGGREAVAAAEAEAGALPGRRPASPGGRD